MGGGNRGRARGRRDRGRENYRVRVREPGRILNATPDTSRLKCNSDRGRAITDNKPRRDSGGVIRWWMAANTKTQLADGVGSSFSTLPWIV
jgi:hypothetical protein